MTSPTPDTLPAPRRSFVMLALGALTGLCIAGHGLFSAAAGDATALPPGAVARVNQGQILLTDFRAQTETLFDVPFDKSTLQQRKEVLDSMITEELLVQRALETSVPATDASVREALVAAVQLQSTADIAAAAPTEAQLRAYYTAHPERYMSTGMMRVHDLLLPVSAGADTGSALRVASQAAQALRGGKSIAAVSAVYQLRPNPALGQEPQLDVAVSRILGPALFAAARRLGAGQASDAIAAPDGVHVLYCSASTPSVRRDYASVKPQLTGDFKRDASARAQRDYAAYLRQKSTVIVDQRMLAPTRKN